MKQKADFGRFLQAEKIYNLKDMRLTSFLGHEV